MRNYGTTPSEEATWNITDIAIIARVHMVMGFIFFIFFSETRWLYGRRQYGEGKKQKG
jgi:hypothetical protein